MAHIPLQFECLEESVNSERICCNGLRLKTLLPCIFPLDNAAAKFDAVVILAVAEWLLQIRTISDMLLWWLWLAMEFHVIH